MVIRPLHLVDCLRLEIEGDINKLDLKQLQMQLELCGHAKSIELDLTAVIFAGSDFLNFLVNLRRRRPEIAARLEIINPNDVISELLEMTQLDRTYRVRHAELADISG
jgi:anti-anti-sigma regulatory factor